MAKTKKARSESKNVVEKRKVSQSSTKTPKDKLNKKEDLPKSKTYNLFEFKNIVDLVYDCDSLSIIRKHFSDHIDKIISKYNLNNCEVLFLYLPYSNIDENTADKFYNAIPKNKTQKILLIINSPGGRVEPAYLISKACKEFSESFIASIPRKAKSAATLISLGADEIHMGAMSELGPIDPQFGGLPALGLSSALERLALLSTKYPKSSEMFASYLTNKLDLGVLGYFERVSESAVQYAQRLLKGKKFPGKENAESVANRFVYAYKDHSFVIDRDEAAQSLGNHIKTDTEEYNLGNDIHNFLEQLNLCTRAFKKQNTSIVGGKIDVGFDDKDKD